MVFEVKVNKILSQTERNNHQTKCTFLCCFYFSFFRTFLSAESNRMEEKSCVVNEISGMAILVPHAC